MNAPIKGSVYRYKQPMVCQKSNRQPTIYPAGYSSAYQCSAPPRRERMFPALVPPPAAELENEQLPAPPVPALKNVVISFLPSLRPNAPSTYSPLEHIDQLLPLIQKEIKESRSKGAHELLVKMALNNKLLFYELSAIRIQAIVRQFIARLRVERIRRRMELFMKITEDCAARYLEEFILSTSFELSLDFYRQHRRFKLLQDSVERELVICIEKIRDEVLVEVIAEVAKETISDAINVVVQMRNAAHLGKKDEAVALPSPVKAVVKLQNPLVVLVDQVVNDAVHAFIRGVVGEAVQEEAQVYLLGQHCDRIYASIAAEVMLEVLVDVIQIYFGEHVDCTDALVDALYQRLYAQHRSSANAATSPAKLRRRTTVHTAMPKG